MLGNHSKLCVRVGVMLNHQRVSGFKPLLWPLWLQGVMAESMPSTNHVLLRSNRDAVPNTVDGSALSVCTGILVHQENVEQL